MPKASRNELSLRLAEEFGGHGVRVNTIHPGPIESEVLGTVFLAMDRLGGDAEGSTAADLLRRMTLARSSDGGPPKHTFPVVGEVVDGALFLVSDESAALNGQEIKITHGLATPRDAGSLFLDRPGLRIVDDTGASVILLAGDELNDALLIARAQTAVGASVLLGVAGEEQLHAASVSLDGGPVDAMIRPVIADHSRPETVAAALRRLDEGG